MEAATWGQMGLLFFIQAKTSTSLIIGVGSLHCGNLQDQAITL